MRKIKLSLILVFATLYCNANTLYVSKAGNNTNGNSWSNAFSTIQDALTASVAGDEIWVAQGTYVIPATANQLSFKEGVNVYGGFAGSESTLTSRSNDPSLTIIEHADTSKISFRLLTSINLNTPTTWDGFTFDGKKAGTGVKLSGNCTLQNSVVKNCMVTNGSGAGVYMVSGSDFIPVSLINTVVENNVLKSSTASTAQIGGAGICARNNSKLVLIDGCTVRNNSLEGISPSGNLEGMGAGIYIYEGIIRNTTVDNNRVWNSANDAYSLNNFTGAGIAIVPENLSVAANDLLIENCKITSNVSISRGGGIVIDPRWSGQYQGNYTISKTIIANNKSIFSVGGGMLIGAATVQTGPGWTLNITNSVIANNSTVDTGAGAGIYVNIGCIFNVTNTTIVNNKTGKYGGSGIFLQGTQHTIKPTFKNMVCWGNTSTTVTADLSQIRVNNQPATLVFSAVQDLIPAGAQFVNSTLGDNIILNASNTHAEGPGFIAPDDSVGYYVSYNGTADWRLSSNSILVDAGNDYLNDDLQGTFRPQGDYSDIGAYERTIKTAVVNPKSDKNIAYVSNSKMIINNKEDLKSVNVYNLQGTLIKSVLLNDGYNEISLPINQLYLIKAGDFTQKILVY